MTELLTIIGWFDLIGTAVYAGGALYAAVVAAPSARGRWAMRAAVVLLTVTWGLAFVVTTLRLSPLSAAHGLGLIWDVASTQWGILWLLRCAGLAILIACPLGSGRQALVTAAWLLMRSLQSHAGAHGLLVAVVDWVHLLAACAWLGGLVQFVLGSDAAAAADAARFGRVATVAVMALILAGAYGAVVHVPDLNDLTDTSYGRALLVKIGAALTLFALGGINHFWYGRAAQHDGTRLRRMVRAEIAAGLVVLLLSALLGALPMPQPPAG
jgi:putative copper export protein